MPKIGEGEIRKGDLPPGSHQMLRDRHAGEDVKAAAATRDQDAVAFSSFSRKEIIVPARGGRINENRRCVRSPSSRGLRAL